MVVSFALRWVDFGLLVSGLSSAGFLNGLASDGTEMLRSRRGATCSGGGEGVRSVCSEGTEANDVFCS